MKLNTKDQEPQRHNKYWKKFLAYIVRTDGNKKTLNFTFKSTSFITILIILSGLSILLSLYVYKQEPSIPLVKEQKVWLSKELTICNEAWSKKDIDPTLYFRSLGVEIFEQESQLKPELAYPGCVACECKTGEILYLYVNKSDILEFEGFIISPGP